MTDGLKLASTESSSADRQRLLPVYRADPDRSAQRAGRTRCRSTEQCGEFAWEKGDLERSAIQEFRHARNENSTGLAACVCERLGTRGGRSTVTQDIWWAFHVLAALIAVGLLAASGGSRPADSAEGPAAIALASALCHR